jgi:hypothetical protein
MRSSGVERPACPYKHRSLLNEIDEAREKGLAIGGGFLRFSEVLERSELIARNQILHGLLIELSRLFIVPEGAPRRRTALVRLKLNIVFSAA